MGFCAFLRGWASFHVTLDAVTVPIFARKQDGIILAAFWISYLRDSSNLLVAFEISLFWRRQVSLFYIIKSIFDGSAEKKATEPSPINSPESSFPD